jgi:hypothetical protein
MYCEFVLLYKGNRPFYWDTMIFMPSTGNLPAGWPDWANFRPLGGCLLWEFFKITEVAQMFGLLFAQYKLCMYLLWHSMGWATHWVTILQIHLVTLPTSRNYVTHMPLSTKRTRVQTDERAAACDILQTKKLLIEPLCPKSKVPIKCTSPSVYAGRKKLHQF